MAYQCQCGNNERFYEVFDVAIDAVDGEGHFLEMKDRSVSFTFAVSAIVKFPTKNFGAM